MLLRCLLAVLALLSARSAPAQDAPGVDPARLAVLARGVNLSHWLWLPHAADEAARRAFITAPELRALADAGLTHARLPVEPSFLWDEQAHAIRPAPLREFLDAVDLVLDAGLGVVVDPHPTRSPWVGGTGLQTGQDGPAPGAARPAPFAEFQRFWSDLAAALAQTDPQRVFLEVMNEPHDIPAAEWAAAQASLVGAIRARAPRHTIIATGAEWGSLDGLLALEPLPDRNIVYSFHFYEPHNFTHQGATWGFAPWRHMKDLPWPATRERLESAAAAMADEQAAAAVRWSAREPWDAAWVRGRIEGAAAWGGDHGVPVWCGEYGVFSEHAPRESRLNWLRDVNAALDEFGIGRAMWDYCGGFALAEGPPGRRRIDAAAAGAIGLTSPPPSPAPPPR